MIKGRRQWNMPRLQKFSQLKGEKRVHFKARSNITAMCPGISAFLTTLESGDLCVPTFGKFQDAFLFMTVGKQLLHAWTYRARAVSKYMQTFSFVLDGGNVKRNSCLKLHAFFKSTNFLTAAILQRLRLEQKSICWQIFSG